MPNYDFHTLSSEDFELLIRDLLNARERARESDIHFRSFPGGKDDGIDLLYGSWHNQHEIIVQIKHNVKSTFPKLHYKLTHGENGSLSEVAKIRKHNPKRYVFVTALGLNLDNKEQIKSLFSPYILAIEDVMDQTDVNQLLGEYPTVETDHFKLWFPGVPVLQRVLHKHDFSKAQHFVDSITRKRSLNVTRPEFTTAIDQLKTEKCLIITGAPGIGKTFFAEMIAFKFISEGCSVQHIYNTISEAEPLLNDDSSHQLFYFDNFLGYTQYEIRQAGAGEYAFFQLLDRIRSMQNKYLLVTTRTSILNDFENRSERYRNAGIAKYRCSLSETSFPVYKKIEMIINHIKTNHIPKEYTKTVMEEPYLDYIAQHTNFSPRLIEFVTDERNYTQISPDRYYRYIGDQLDNPKEIWSHAWHEQLTDHDRFFLTTLFSFQTNVPKIMLEAAFDRRVRYEIEVNRIPRINDAFLKTYNKLLDGFICVDDSEKIDFINPSLKDYLQHYLNNNHIENLRIANGACYVEQILHLFLPKTGKGMALYPDDYLFTQIVKKGFRAAIRIYNNYDATVESTYLALCHSLILSSFYENKSSGKPILTFLKKVDWRLKEAMLDGNHLLSLLKRVRNIPGATKLISPWMNHVIGYIMKDYWEWESFQETIAVFEAYNRAYTAYISDADHAERTKYRIELFVIGRVSNTIQDLKLNATSETQVTEAKNKLHAELRMFYDLSGIDGNFTLSSFEREDWNKIVEQNALVEEYFKEIF